MAFRAYGYLRSAGVALRELVAAHGRSPTTWSRFLGGKLEKEPAGIRDQVEQFFAKRTGKRAPRDFWELAAEAPPAHTAPTGADPMLLHAQSLSRAARRQWELFDNPFGIEALARPDEPGQTRIRDLFIPAAHQVVVARMADAIRTSGFVAVAGESGSGKSTLLERAMANVEDARVRVTLIRPANIERKKLNPVHLSSEIIRQVTGDRPPSCANERDAMAERILTERYREGHRAVLVIDDAHQLSTQTLKDLKHYHELRYGFAKLLGIILLGQTELSHRFREGNFELREVLQRCEVITLPPMRAAGEVAEYLATRLGWFGRQLGDVFRGDAVTELERRLGEHDQQYPLLVNNAATAAMNIAAGGRGNPLVTADDVEAVWALTAVELQELGL